MYLNVHKLAISTDGRIVGVATLPMLEAMHVSRTLEHPVGREGQVSRLKNLMMIDRFEGKLAKVPRPSSRGQPMELHGAGHVFGWTSSLCGCYL
jgi:hypothetical protein